MILTLSQPQASGLAHELFRVVVLDADDPKVTGWKRMIDKTTGDLFKQRDARLEPGSRVLVASNRVQAQGGERFGDFTVVYGWGQSAFLHGPIGWTEWDRLPLPRNSIVGSAVVEAVAPVEVDDGIKVPTPPPVMLLYGSMAIYFSDKPGEGRDLTADLPWLPADLVGKVALVVKDAKPCPPVPLSEWSQE